MQCYFLISVFPMHWIETVQLYWKIKSCWRRIWVGILVSVIKWPFDQSILWPLLHTADAFDNSYLNKSRWWLILCWSWPHLCLTFVICRVHSVTEPILRLPGSRTGILVPDTPQRAEPGFLSQQLVLRQSMVGADVGKTLGTIKLGSESLSSFVG